MRSFLQCCLHRAFTLIRDGYSQAIAAGGAILLSACVAGLPQSQKLQDVTAADLDAAIAMAKASGDADGQACWESVKAALVAAGPGAQVEIKGVASAWQEARNVRRGVQAGIDPTVHRNCAVLVVDGEQTLLRLGVRGARLAPH